MKTVLPPTTNYTTRNNLENPRQHLSREESGDQDGKVVRMTNSFLPFPWQLHALLEAADREGFNQIVSWIDDSGFKVHNPTLFVKHIMPRFFKRQSKYKSFLRQVNLWQFKRLTRSRGPTCKNGYFHEFFQRYDTS
jgi:hypothetical protein